MCAVEFEPFWTDCSTLIARVLDDEMPAFENLHQTCTHPGARAARCNDAETSCCSLDRGCCATQSDVRELIYDIATADCNGGWRKILEDVSYTGVSVSDSVHFSEAGEWTQIAAVRKSGYVGCNCGAATPQCNDCATTVTAENCCHNSNNNW
jgi:hypothetical protein|eukprot:COSAG06_NODE_5939_length_3198_cov_2.294288_2_plen_152_part_00